MTDDPLKSPIHVARIQPSNRQVTYLFLREDSSVYRWFEQDTPTEISASTVEEALRLAWKYWKQKDLAFRMLKCGFLYTLPERDEHGTPALFHQMVTSYSTPKGTYFDQERGHDCVVHDASQEALNLWRALQEKTGQVVYKKPAQKITASP